jgi:hypothetical protein
MIIRRFWAAGLLLALLAAGCDSAKPSSAPPPAPAKTAAQKAPSDRGGLENPPPP